MKLKDKQVKAFTLNGETYMSVNGILYILRDCKWIKINGYEKFNV